MLLLLFHYPNRKFSRSTNKSIQSTPTHTIETENNKVNQSVDTPIKFKSLFPQITSFHSQKEERENIPLLTCLQHLSLTCKLTNLKSSLLFTNILEKTQRSLLYTLFPPFPR